jgi:hypothetical protein
MAKQLQRTYVFTPGLAGAGTILIPGKVDQNQLLVITNVTRNTVLYNFAVSTYSGTTVTYNRSAPTAFPQVLQNNDGYTQINLVVDTSGQSAADNLQIFTERLETIVRPWAMGTDAFERTRMAAPQSMIDADFEYGLQPTKWQTISYMRGYPSIYEIPGTDLQTVVNITTDASGGTSSDASLESLITVQTSSPHSLTTGTAITVKALLPTITGFNRAEGSFIINAVTSTNFFNYYAKAKVGTNSGDSVYSPTVQIRKGGFYTGASVGTPTYTYAGGGASTTATITVSFATNHGLIPGNTIISAVTSDNGSNNHTLAQGPFYITSVTNLTTIQFLARNVGTITGTITGAIYPRPDSFYIHRPLDGGVTLGTGGPQHGSQAVRQSKKYIRYQSGKAINYNTGALFAPNYDLRSLSASGTLAGSTVTATTDDIDHGLQIGAVINISGATTSGYNGNYTVNSVIDERTFTFLSTGTLGSATSTLGNPAVVSLVSWHGATVRAGTFDEQNGVYWQYDGQYMAVGLRSSTFQISGNVSATPDSNLIVGTNTRFDQQLAAGDRLVLKGMSHVVGTVTSATYLTVTPDYRGVTSVNTVKMGKTRDILVPQFQWNIDRCDGSNGPFNPSGYNLQPNKMQMIGLQWTWYGAGFIEFLLRGPDGAYIPVHRIKNSNVNTEAYMRSGNQPVRYEVQNESARSTLAVAMGSGDATMTITEVTYFANSGTVYIDNELISYTSRSATSGTAVLSGLTRAASLTQFVGGTNRSFQAGPAAAHTQGTGVVLVSQTASPIISHWGSAFLTDGGFDQDRGYIFNYQATNISVGTRKTTAFAIRLAPSVSNAITGDLGVRELINRAQFLLQGIEITAGGGASSNSALVIEGILNPSNYPSSPTNIVWNSLNSVTIPTGQPSFSQVANGTSIIFDNTATINTTANNNFAPGSTVIGVNSTASIAIGDAVASTSTTSTLAGGTIVNAIGAGTVTLNNPLIGGMFNNTPLTFSRNAYALPGETIFSFISSPANKDSLDLSALKELTNTPIGGRGTYPNGPDVLMINVYLTQGTAINANLVLRWGEAQA